MKADWPSFLLCSTGNISKVRYSAPLSSSAGTTAHQTQYLTSYSMVNDAEINLLSAANAQTSLQRFV